MHGGNKVLKRVFYQSAFSSLHHPESRAFYDRKRAQRSYARRAYPLYRPTHVQRAMAMVLKAVGLQPQGRLNDMLTRAGLWFLHRSASKYAAQGA